MYKLFIVFIVICNMTSFAYADIFTSSVHVEATAENVQKAKEMAIKEGRLKQLRNTLHNITIKDYYRKIDSILDLKNSLLFEKSIKINN